MATKASPRLLLTTDAQGNAFGTRFSGRPAIIESIETAAISRIVVEHSTYVISLTVHYRGGEAAIKHGSGTGTVDVIVLEPGEFITKIEGQQQVGYVNNLTFFDSEGRSWGPYGQLIDAPRFCWDGASLVEGAVSLQMGLLYFNGSWDPPAISQLEAVFAEYPAVEKPAVADPPGVVIYERGTTGISSSVPAGLSTFAQTLISQIVTLHVGSEGIVFHVYEDILCRLQFFRAALKGDFIEASEKKVTMPEDEPDVVSALIQFLYDGRYTYAFQTGEETTDDQSTPPIELSEGIFHARVYALAFKYDCQGLVTAANNSLVYVLKGLKGIDVVHFLKEAHEIGWSIADWEEDDDMKDFKKQLAILLKQLFESKREEMEFIMLECPPLGCDLLRLTLSS